MYVHKRKMAVIGHHKNPHNTSHIAYSCSSRFASHGIKNYLYIYLMKVIPETRRVH